MSAGGTEQALGERSERGPRPISAGCRRGFGARRGLRAQRRPPGHHLAVVGRRAPARRDHQGALPQRLDAGPRRAHRRAHAAGRWTSLRRPPSDDRGWSWPRVHLHKIHEVLDISDRITVLRGGRNVGTIPAAEASRARLVELMVGRTVALESQPSRGSGGQVRLSVKDLRVKGDRGIEAVRGLSLEVSAGEIVGIAGVSGNGQRDLSEAIAGLRSPLSGSIRLGDAELAGANPADARAGGLAYVPEERMRDGVVPAFTSHRTSCSWRIGVVTTPGSGSCAPARSSSSLPGADLRFRREDAFAGNSGPEPLGREHPKADHGP